MAVALLTHFKWWYMEVLQEVIRQFIILLGGSLASDDLYLLDLRNGDQAAQWMIVPVVG